MKIEVRYRALYRYASRVSFSPHTFRLFPRGDANVLIEKREFITNAGADVQDRRDLFDNPIAFCFYPKPGRDLRAKLTLRLHLRERNAFHFLLDPHALDFPFRYHAGEQQVLAPFLDASRAVRLPFWDLKRQPTVLALVELNEAIYKNVRYERREEGAARSPAETLATGEGACRDFAVLLAETLRGVGIAARLASGYLCEFGEKEKRAAGAMHAWTEAFLPGAGWVGLDPTNGVFCNHNHITTAVGRTPEEIAPITGSYFNKTRVESEMTTKLELVKCRK
jgi:transglutaminase-like putative cysteine protease